MENKIRLLPEIVANQIAAGEVVNNPSSVVKEMMENAIDAGATSVTVNYRNAGLELIQIVDNGCGMSPLDARMAFDRHATSKITTLDDVYRLHTFGFRGEALASIAAVSQVELRTRRAEDEVGTVTIVNGGEFVSQTPAMCPAGSQFLVRNLFYTAPARRKFNSDRTRMVSDIKKEFRRVALCYPQVRCELMSNDMPIVTLPAASLQERIIDVVGRYIRTNLLEVSVDTTIVKVSGFVGRPAAAKQKNAEQYLFVNGRYFRSPQIYRSIMKAYEKLIPENCSPSFFLYLTVDTDRVDVNVHPQKTEVRFADAEDVTQIVTAAVRSTLAKSGAVSMMDFDNSSAIEIPVMKSRPEVLYSEPRSSSNDDYNPFREDYTAGASSDGDVDFTGFDAPYDGSMEGAPAAGRSSAAAMKDIPSRGYSSPSVGSDRGLRDMSWGEMPLSSEFAVETDAAVPMASDGYREIASSAVSSAETFEVPSSAGESTLEFIASGAVQQSIEHAEPISFSDCLPLGNGYAVAICGGRSVAVDLRRARERIVYDGCMAAVGCSAVPSQELLFPERLVLSENDYALLAEHAAELAAVGFHLEPSGDCAVEMRGIPSCVDAEQADSLLFDLLREIEGSGDAGERMREEMVRTIASRAARSTVRGLSREETANLLRQLCECENFSFSPSGKAIMTDLTADDLKAKLS
ncbi:MAG: DNA mismatch repair endonuclease MutL [Alistipes sp.]|nr:DNA mismatch repair endonuclease MutL [Alistipes sp.]